MKRLAPALLLVAACTGNAPITPQVAATQGPEVVYRVHHADSTILMDHLTIAGDTLRGLARVKNPNASRPAVSLPLAEVKALTVAHPDQEGLLLFALPIALFVGLIVSFSAGMGND